MHTASIRPPSVASNAPYRPTRLSSCRTIELPHALHGFTLIELMVVVSIVAILSFFATPSFVSTIRNGEIASASESLRDAVVLARTEAIRRGSTVAVMPGAGSCTTWSCGWHLALIQNDAEVTPSLREAELPTGLAVSLVNIGTVPQVRLEFRANGTLNPLTLPIVNGQVRYLSIANAANPTHASYPARAVLLDTGRICKTGDRTRDLTCPI